MLEDGILPKIVTDTVNYLYKDALESQRKNEFEDACNSFTALLNLMREHIDDSHPSMARMYVDYASALIDLQVEKTLVNAVAEENIEKVEGDETQDSENSYGDDPILGNPVIIKTGEDEGSNDDNKNNNVGFEQPDAEKNESDSELAFNLLETARVVLEEHPNDKLCNEYYVKCRGLIALIFKENCDFDSSLEESEVAKKFYRDNNVDDRRSYADLCFHRGYCHLMKMNPEDAISDYQDAVDSLALLKAKSDEEKLEIDDIIANLNEQIDLCKKYDLSKLNITNNLLDFMKSWSRKTQSDDKEKDLNENNAVKRKTDTASDVNHLVKKSKTDERKSKSSSLIEFKN